MKSFVQWAGDTKKELPVYSTDEGGGSTARGGIA